jgi:uncharacterized membrane protein YvbJ
MDITIELHCDKCGSANLSLPEQEEDAISCNDCGEGHGSVAALRDDLFAHALQQSAERRRRDAERLS